MNVTVAELAKRLGAELVGASTGLENQITGVKPVQAAGDGDVSFVTGAKHQATARKSGAAAVIVAKSIDGLRMPQLVVKDVNAALIETLSLFAPGLTPPAEGVDASARIGANVQLGRGASIGPHAAIDDNDTIAPPPAASKCGSAACDPTMTARRFTR